MSNDAQILFVFAQNIADAHDRFDLLGVESRKKIAPY
jgi:hypothetical protein